MPSDGIEPRAGGNAADARWHPVRDDGVREPLAFDHAEILAAAIERLRSKVEYTSLPAFLLPEEFTLTELQRVYEIVLDRPVDKSAFRTRVMAADLVRSAAPAHRPQPPRAALPAQGPPAPGVLSADLQPARRLILASASRSSFPQTRSLHVLVCSRAPRRCAVPAALRTRQLIPELAFATVSLTPVGSLLVATLRCPASLRAAGISVCRRSHDRPHRASRRSLKGLQQPPLTRSHNAATDSDSDSPDQH